MNDTRDKLRSARATLDPIVGRRIPTTDTELDECVRALEELRRACALYADAVWTTPAEVANFLGVMAGSLKEVADRIKNRQKATK
jgi:hypothetical protein